MHTVVETPPYLADAERHFTTDERSAIVDTIAADPHCGVVVPGSGGIRKVRFGVAGRGKSGGGDNIPIFLLAAFAKNEKSDLTAKERLALGKTVTDMLASYRRRK